ncbi:related to N-alpha-acetyltransferase 30 [Hanseniaspora guilliermondii]|uniref:Related to N-alpha-acetyltransferase 30 n=1 Tax=Hanseniaspora guilliermondii TaxID=56406 RepID=A0A1L0B5S1_9ASCO|nr:related to N-alpha-acetyltransferase 30 [Hanseniaspora guilliermondii]
MLSVLTNKQINTIEEKYTTHNLKTTLTNSSAGFIQDKKNIIKLIDNNLSEPYSSYVYIYFLNNFPELCYYIKEGEDIVGCIIGKCDTHKSSRLRGYIGMLVVCKKKRGEQLGKYLIMKELEHFKNQSKCDEVVLETQCNNTVALNLYKKFGFICLKRYKHFYNENQDGKDAFMLILGFTEKCGQRGVFLQQSIMESLSI